MGAQTPISYTKLFCSILLASPQNRQRGGKTHRKSLNIGNTV
jgi:hypothetical protein